MLECGYCSQEFQPDEVYCRRLSAAMACSKLDLVQRAVLSAVAESIEKGATIDLGDGNFQQVPGSEDAINAQRRADLYQSQSALLDQLIDAHQQGDTPRVDMILDRLTVTHMAITFEELLDYRASLVAVNGAASQRSAG
jgi:hypothetical protein